MSVKRKSPIGVFFTIVVIVLIAGILYYGLVLCTQAGPDASDEADRAKLRLNADNIANIGSISYSLFCDELKAAVTESEYKEIAAKKNPDEQTFELFEKISSVEKKINFPQTLALYYCGTEEIPIKGVVKVKGIEYEVTHSITFAPNVKTFEPEIVDWDITVTRITYA